MAKRFLRLSEVIMRVGYSRPSIYRKIDHNEFPAPVNLGGRAVGWIESDIDAWIESRINSRIVTSHEPAFALGAQETA
jgi:prophage regulatory protein